MSLVKKNIFPVSLDPISAIKLPFRMNALSALFVGTLSYLPIAALAADETVIDAKSPSVNVAANAQQSNEEEIETPTEVLIRVERQKTLKTVHDEPSSISVITASDLNTELASDYQTITKRLANITFNQANTRGASLSIRGIGKRGFAEVQDPSVLVSLDGVSFGLTALGNFDFNDIETVEVQRGVTGTTGGKGGSAGQLSFTTKRPSFTPSSEFSITYGQRNTEVLKAAAGGPIIDDLLAWRGAIYLDKADGYYKNSYAYDDNNTFYNRARTAARIQFLLTPTENFSARVSFDKQPKAPQLENGLTFRHDQPLTYADGTLTDASGTTARSKLAGYTDASGKFTAGRAWFTGRPSPETPGRNYSYEQDYNVEEGYGKLTSNEYQGQYLSTQGTSAELIWDIDDIKLSSLTAYREFYFNAHNDDVTSFDINKQGGGGVDYNQYSQEFKIQSKLGDSIEYQAGLYFIKTSDDVQSRTSWGSDAGAWNASTGQYNNLERNAATNRGAGLALLKDSLEDAYKKGDIFVETKSAAIYGSLDWHETESATLTAGLRVGDEDRSSTDVIQLVNNGSGGAFNPVTVNGIQKIQLGGFNSSSKGELTKVDPITGLIVDLPNDATQLNLADSIAYKYYGVASTGTPGAAYKSLTPKQQQQVADVKAIRLAGIGFLTNPVTSNYKDTLYTASLSQSYKINDDLTVYGTLQHGDKAGTGFNINGIDSPVKAETTDGVELGIKTFFFDQELTFNIDAYRLNIRNYQQAIRVLDQYTYEVNNLNNISNDIPPYVTAQGNLPKVIAQGVEFDGTYTGIEHFTFRFSGAYNDTHYDEYPNAPLPPELGHLGKLTPPVLYIDRSGEKLPGAPEYTFNVGVQYRRAFDKAEFHTAINAAYTGDYFNGDDFSTYSKIKGYWIADGSIGIAPLTNKFDLNLVVKNILDAKPHEPAWTTYEPYIYRRWVGVEFSGKF
jgi:iron complex outermembrane receptor protein